MINESSAQFSIPVLSTQYLRNGDNEPPLLNDITVTTNATQHNDDRVCDLLNDVDPVSNPLVSSVLSGTSDIPAGVTTDPAGVVN